MPARKRHGDDTEATVNRRRVVAALGATVVSGIAGCSSGSGNDGGATQTQSGSGGQQGDDSGSGGQGGDGGEGGCPGDSLSYVTQEYSAEGYEGVVGTCQVPEAAQVSSDGTGSAASGFRLDMEYGSGGFVSLDVGATLSADSTVDEVASRIEDTVDQYDLVSSTAGYESSLEEWTALVSGESIAGQLAVPVRAHVVFAYPDGVLNLQIDASGEPGCLDTSGQIHLTLVESQQPA